MRMGSIKERERCRGGAGGKEGWRWGVVCSWVICEHGKCTTFTFT